MKRKPQVLKIPAARNPFVALAIFKKAGSHRKTEKALRRQEKVLQVRSSPVEHSAFTTYN